MWYLHIEYAQNMEDLKQNGSLFTQNIYIEILQMYIYNEPLSALNSERKVLQSTPND